MHRSFKKYRGSKPLVRDKLLKALIAVSLALMASCQSEEERKAQKIKLNKERVAHCERLCRSCKQMHRDLIQGE